MAEIYGKKGDMFGEHIVYTALLNLPNDWLVYSQPTIVTDNGNRHPDFVVVHPELGLIVLDVKDWIEILDIERDKARIRQRDKSIEWRGSPVEQAKNHCFAISDELKKFPELMDDKDRLLVTWRYAGILPQLDMGDVNRLKIVWGRDYVFGLPNIEKNNQENSLRSIPGPKRPKLSDRQIDIIRCIIDSSLRVGDNGILDKHQEEYAKSDFTRTIPKPTTDIGYQQTFDGIDSLESIPEEITDTSKTQSVRLIRGSAGTGKTDVIILRCKYLKEYFSETKNLVTTFNIPVAETRFQSALKELSPTITFKRFGQICQDIYFKRYSMITEPQNSKGVVNAIFERESKFERIKTDYDDDFLVDEFQWMKETELTTREKYLNTVREGRGGVKGRTLSKSQKEIVFDFFETYQKYLAELPALDWTDFFHRALKIMQNNEIDYPKYDEIMIDEAQHFAPKWIELLRLLLTENGRLFLCEDPSQSVYRTYSWYQKGVEVRGRTKILKIPYRSTRQILKAAYALVSNNQVAQNLLKESDDFEWPDLDAEGIRNGNLPEIHLHMPFLNQQEFIERKIEKLLKRGFHPTDIAILHTQKYALDPFEEMKRNGIIVDDVKRITGMEYRVVFIPKLNDFLYKYEQEDKIGMEANLSSLYTAITRSKDLVYILNEKSLPRIIDEIKDHVHIVRHS